MSLPEFHIVIPARMGSSRLPGKPLLDLGGAPIIEHVWQRSVAAGARSVTIATDSEQIMTAAQDFGANAMLTASDHQSGTDRVAEVATAKGWSHEIIINVQGDEPFMPLAAIHQVVGLLADNPAADLATLSTPLDDEAQWYDPNCVKVVTDRARFALLFSRAPIPYPRQPSALIAQRHIGIYGYRAASLATMVAEPPCALELAESLEQLRALWIGQRIIVGEAHARPPAGIDTEDDLAAARRALPR